MPDEDARSGQQHTGQQHTGQQHAGRHLASDLRALREDRNLSEDELRETLRVPPGLFEAFESGRLLEHPMFNRVYLRSFMRSYADATNVPSSAALSALDATLGGDYEEGQLQREIEAEKERSEKKDRADEEAASAAEEEAAEEGAPEEDAAPEGETREEASAAGEGAPAEESGAAAAGGAAAGATAAEAVEEEPDWTTQSPPGASAEEAEQRQREREEQARTRAEEKEQRAEQQQREREERAERGPQREEREREERDRPAQREERRHRRRTRSSGNAGKWIVGALALIALAVAAFFILRSTGGESPEATTTAADTAADTAGGGSEQRRPQDQRPAAHLQLGQTLNFTVVAQGGPVKNLKVTRDQDVRRPYWIENGHATVFPAHQRIVIENPAGETAPLENLRLFAEGYAYPTDQRDNQGRIVITRQKLQSFADTLRGQPASVPAQRDTASLSGL